MSDLEKDVEEIGDGAKLLLARIETHPEEFEAVYGGESPQYTIGSRSWAQVVSTYWRSLNPTEQAAITEALTEANRRNFHSAVMREILAPEQMSLPGLEPVAYQATAVKGLTSPTLRIKGSTS